MEARDKPLIAAMAGLAATYPRFGYRRINVFKVSLKHVMRSGRLGVAALTKSGLVVGERLGIDASII